MPTKAELLREGQPAEMTATPRSAGLGVLADLLRSGRDFANKAQIPKAVPLIGGQGLGDLTLGKAPEEFNEWSYGNAPVRINPLAGRTASFVPEVKPGRKEGLGDALLAVQGVPGGNKAMLAALSGGLPGPADLAVHLPHLPSKPNQNVGTRFTREDVGNLVPKKPRNIEDMKDAQILGNPWDATSRNQRITSVSEEVLPEPVITTGGHDFSRDKAHVKAGVGGASNPEIASRVQKRTDIASQENLDAGGSGRVFQMPLTMDPVTSSYFSSMPSSVQLELLRNANLDPATLRKLNEKMRGFGVQVPKKGTVYPFGDFVGFEDLGAVREQLRVGMGSRATPGETRKALTEVLAQKANQKALRYNHEDLLAAVHDPFLHGVPKGYAGNTIIEGKPGASLMDPTHPDYGANTAGQYFGTLGINAPFEVIAPKTWDKLLREFGGKTSGMSPAQVRNMILGTLEKRNVGVSEKVDQQVIDSVNQWREAQQRAAR